MAEKKKQHYVPRSYLKLFSWDGKKSINIFNIESGRLIREGNLKNQCYEAYFYGKDLVIENVFSDIETAAIHTITDIIKSNSVPKRFSEKHNLILTHVILQLSRTKYAAEATDELTDKFLKLLMEKDGRISREQLDQVNVKNVNPTILPLGAAAQSVHLAMDLTCKILINKTKLSFITSDNPVVLYNQACEHLTLGSQTGIACKGLKIIFPLSPTHVLIFYDEKIYKIGKKRQPFADILMENDVRQLNSLQWLNALDNVYFDKTLSPLEIMNEAKKYIKKRNPIKSYLDEYSEGISDDGTESILLHMHKPDLNIKMNLQAIKQLRTLTEDEMYNRQTSLRDFNFYKVHKTFLEAVKEGRYKLSDLPIFIEKELMEPI